MGYLCVNFSLRRSLCYRLRPDIRDRQTDVIRQTDVRQHHRLMPPPRGRRHNNLPLIAEKCVRLYRHASRTYITMITTPVFVLLDHRRVVQSTSVTSINKQAVRPVVEPPHYAPAPCKWRLCGGRQAAARSGRWHINRWRRDKLCGDLNSQPKRPGDLDL